MGAAESQAAERVGRYEIAGRLATGGMAEIVLGRLVGPSGFERPVVIKRILPHLAEQQSFVSMFLDEARLAAQIRHPNVVQVQELSQDGTELYLVMEYLEGENAAGVVRRCMVKQRPTDYALIAFILAEACAGLHAAHELKDARGRLIGLVHRDVSPQNIFVTYAGGVKVLDFGIAKAADRITQTEAGQLKGKFEYMSPEQCRGKPLDRRSDVFALGIVLYELTTRRRLFKRANKLAVLEAVWKDPIVPPSRGLADYPVPLERVVLKALSRDPDQRYATANEMRRALLEAMREMNAPLAPEEALAQLMHEVFPDRVQAKQDMLSRLRAGGQLVNVPAAETDESVELPEVEVGTASFRSRLESGFSFGSLSSSTDAYGLERAKRARSRMLVLGVGAAAAVLLVALGAMLARPETPPPQTMTALGRNPITPLLALATPAPKSYVKIDLVSFPPGATVRLAGEDRGKTPLELALEQGDAQLDLRIELDGYVAAVEKLVPDMNQRLRVRLNKADENKKRTSSVQVTRPKTEPKTGGGFRRFD